MTSLFVSTASIRSSRIGEAVRRLVSRGVDGIELTGGTEWYPELEQELRAHRAAGIRLLCHNYFPPPREHFVVNLASLDPSIQQRSRELLATAIRLSASLGARAFGLHAGFLVDFNRAEAGATIGRRPLAGRAEAMDAFLAGHDSLDDLAGCCGLTLYVENNVYTAANFAVYGADNPLFLTSHADYVELQSRRRFNLLLDLGHLKVSCRTLGLDFADEFQRLAPASDYWHLSDNDGAVDSNGPLSAGSEMAAMITRCARFPSLATVEVAGEEPALASLGCARALLGGSA